MDRYLILADSRVKHVDWLIRRVTPGNQYVDLSSGEPVMRVAEEGRHVVEVNIRRPHVPEMKDWSPVGCLALRAGETPEIKLSYDGTALSLHPEQVGHIMAWASQGFPYGARPEVPARSQEQLVIRVSKQGDSGERRVDRLPLVAFSGCRSTGRFVSFADHALKRMILDHTLEQSILSDSDGSEYLVLPIEENANSDEALIRFFDEFYQSIAEDNDYYEFA